nr:NTP transferase domain-containing protein [Cytophagales bacterium]
MEKITLAANSLLNGLILMGGSSSRMQQDKSSLSYHGQQQRDHLMDLLTPHCSRVFLSCNATQAALLADNYPVIQDSFTGIGPIAGIFAALEAFPHAGWLVVACDLPLLKPATLSYLISNRQPQKQATAFKSDVSGRVEPLLTIYESSARHIISNLIQEKNYAPSRALALMDVFELEIPHGEELKNVNYPDEYLRTLAEIRSPLK